MEILWDEPKRLMNLAKHGVDFADVAEAFLFHDAAIEAVRDRRFMAVAPLGDVMVSVIFSFTGTEAISIISARPASRKEQAIYANR